MSTLVEFPSEFTTEERRERDRWSTLALCGLFEASGASVTDGVGSVGECSPKTSTSQE